MMVSLTGIQDKSHKEHLILIDYCKAGDTRKAVDLLERHIMDGGTFLMQRLAEMRGDELTSA